MIATVCPGAALCEAGVTVIFWVGATGVMGVVGVVGVVVGAPLPVYSKTSVARVRSEILNRQYQT